MFTNGPWIVQITAPAIAPEPESSSPGSQFDDYFQLMDQNGTRYGIDGTDGTIKKQLISCRDTGVIIQVWGILQKDVPDAYETQILVTRIEPY